MRSSNLIIALAVVLFSLEAAQSGEVTSWDNGPSVYVDHYKAHGLVSTDDDDNDSPSPPQVHAAHTHEMFGFLDDRADPGYYIYSYDNGLPVVKPLPAGTPVKWHKHWVRTGEDPQHRVPAPGWLQAHPDNPHSWAVIRDPNYGKTPAIPSSQGSSSVNTVLSANTPPAKQEDVVAAINEINTVLNENNTPPVGQLGKQPTAEANQLAAKAVALDNMRHVVQGTVVAIALKNSASAARTPGTGLDFITVPSPGNTSAGVGSEESSSVEEVREGIRNLLANPRVQGGLQTIRSMGQDAFSQKYHDVLKNYDPQVAESTDVRVRAAEAQKEMAKDFFDVFGKIDLANPSEEDIRRISEMPDQLVMNLFRKICDDPTLTVEDYRPHLTSVVNGTDTEPKK